MNYLDPVLLAEARASGRGVRSVLFRHRHLAPRPLGVVLWQLGAEPFTVGALAWGHGPSDRHLVVPGEPRDRELAFRSLAAFARAFNPWFERGKLDPPQLVIPNRATLTLLGRIGRRLAYLPNAGPTPAAPELVRLGRHLRFLEQHAAFPGQQLVLTLTDLLRTHWVTELSDVETQNLTALDAAIEPPPNTTAHEAAFRAEAVGIGPTPLGDEDERLDSLVQAFNAARKRSTEEAVVAPLRRPIEEHYGRLVYDHSWPLLWRCLERERTYPEASRVTRRWLQDLDRLERHLDWVRQTGGIRRLRQRHDQAARTLHDWEEAQRLLLAEEALDDRMRMLPYVLAADALVGRVVSVDRDNWGRKKNRVRRPLVVVRTTERCLMPAGKALRWTETPTAAPYVVLQNEPAARGGSTVTLEYQSGAKTHPLPRVGQEAVFSIHDLDSPHWLDLPKEPPWTHVPAVEVQVDATLEDTTGTESWE